MEAPLEKCVWVSVLAVITTLNWTEIQREL